MAIELNEKQREGLDIAISRYYEGYPYTCIAGYAGTGKSTLVSFIIDALGFDRTSVAYAAYTGKAALVLKQKGCPNAKTTHQLLYNTRQKKDGSFYHIPKERLDQDYELIVIDEVSMLPQVMWDLLLSYHVYVLALGDPGQLPPVSADANKVLDDPHIFLDEIMRQAGESEIIQCSMAIREHKTLLPRKGQEVMILPKNQATTSMFSWADQIICAKNATRNALNLEMRRELWGATDNFPVEGDKIICLHNNWDIVNERGDCLINGMTGFISNIRKEEINIPYVFKGYAIRADFLPDFYDDVDEGPDPYFRDVCMDYKLFMDGEPTLNKKNFAKLAKFFNPMQFDYGYAVTCWKSQGSEYDKVLLFEENFPWDAEEHTKYMYTGATRSRERLVIILK